MLFGGLMLLLHVHLAGSSEMHDVFTESSTPKQTLVPMSFAPTEPLPTATEKATTVTEFLTSTWMIVFFSVFALVIVSSLVVFGVLCYRHRRENYLTGKVQIQDGLQETLVEDTSLQKEGTIQI